VNRTASRTAGEFAIFIASCTAGEFISFIASHISGKKFVSIDAVPPFFHIRMGNTPPRLSLAVLTQPIESSIARDEREGQEKSGKEVLSMEKRPTSFDELPLVLTIDELAPLLNIGRNTAYELVRSNQIRSVKIGSQYRILKHELQEYLGLPNQPPQPEVPTIGSLRRRRGRRSST